MKTILVKVRREVVDTARTRNVKKTLERLARLWPMASFEVCDDCEVEAEID